MDQLSDETLQQEVVAYGQKQIGAWFRNRGLGLLNIVTLAMMIVEFITGRRELSSKDKRDLAKRVIGIIIDLLPSLGFEEAQVEPIEKIGRLLVENVDEIHQQIDGMIDLLSTLTNNPDWINPGKWVSRIERSCFPCRQAKKKKRSQR